MKNSKRLFGALTLLTAFLFVQCRKADKKEIELLNKQSEDLSVEEATDVTIRYTDSAILKATIETPLMIRFPRKEDPYTEMPKGLMARFYDRNGQIDSRLSSRYGINYEAQKLIKLTDSVRVINRQGEQLKSEELFWDQEKKKIYTNKYVIIVRDGEELRGDGFESNETFTKYKILKPHGRVKVKENQTEDELTKDS